MLNLVVGKPRAGKTLFVVRLILEELLNGKKTVVTNFPLILPKVIAWVDSRSGGRDCRVLERLRIIGAGVEVSGYFWRYRGATYADGVFSGWLDLPPPNKVTGFMDLQPMFDSLGPDGTCHHHSCLYAIDEVYNYFRQEEWANTGKGATWYIAQHGKLGDTIWMATHYVTELAKGLTQRTQAFYYLRNMNKEKVMGYFRGLRRLMWQKYPAMKRKDLDPEESGSFVIKQDGACDCYQTDAGVGIPAGMGGDVGERASGLPPWLLAVGLLSIIPLFVWLFPKLFAAGTAKFLTPKGYGVLTNSAASSAAVSDSQPPASVPVVPPRLPESQLPVQPPWFRPAVEAPAPSLVPPSAPVPPPTVTGLWRHGGSVTVYFSTGSESTYPESDVEERGGMLQLRAFPRQPFAWSTPSVSTEKP